MKFAEIKGGSILLGFVPKKNIKGGICIQLKKSLNPSSLPFVYADIEKGKQDYALPKTDIRNIRFIFVKYVV